MWMGVSMASIDDRIEILETKLKQEKAKKQRIEARKRAFESKNKRKEDIRRKILVGAVVLAKVENGEWPRDEFLNMMKKSLIREKDQKLFLLDVF